MISADSTQLQTIDYLNGLAHKELALPPAFQRWEPTRLAFGLKTETYVLAAAGNGIIPKPVNRL